MLPKSKWHHVCFEPKAQDQVDLVFEKRDVLSKAGIYFDSGSGYGCIDWELDWSFRCK